MATWTAGYVADVDYTHGFYRELTPALLAYAGLAQGQRTPNANGPLAYCELGSGQGFSANLLAAANPEIDFYATDFIPSHIAESRRLAADAGTTNVHFFDQSFAEFIDEPSLPMFDIVSLHGIYSWVNEENRKAIVKFVARKLKPGGLVYVSYNTLGWAPATPMREVMYRYGASQGGSSAKRLENAMELMDKLTSVNARYFALYPGIKGRFEGLKKMDRNYLAHEYFNEAWSLLYHGDVAAEFAEAKVTYLASANLLDHVDVINLSEPQRQLLAGIDDLTVREMVRDFITVQQFRRDIFIKGGNVLPTLEGHAAWRDQRFVLSTPRADVPLKVNALQGEATLQADVYEPVLDALASGPKTLGELLVIPSVTAVSAPKVQQALTVLVGANHIQPCLNAAGDAKRVKTVRAFNGAIMRRAQDNAKLVFLASPVTGGGLLVSRLDQLFLLAKRQKQADTAQFIWNILASQGQRLVRDGKALETAEENLEYLRSEYDEFVAKRLQVLTQLGID